ncbi:MAG: DoxX family membrane protein, partial [Gemmatimonadetes bacterium]|nr:DoxX family membrane protein [Gemmatimonadota bacterium]
MNTNQLTQIQAYGITLLRVVLGLVFLMHGGQKLFVYGLEGVT